METHLELPGDAEQLQRALAQRLEDEVHAWRAVRARRSSVTASGVPVLRRTPQTGRVRPRT